MNLLQMNEGSKQMGPKLLFDGVQVAINSGEHIGVIGPNGAGKTTFFKLLVGLEELDSGQLIKMTGLRIEYLEQEVEWDLDITAETYLGKENNRPFWEIKKLGLQLGLEDIHYSKQLKNLSGGFRMRIKLLKLISKDPHLLLLDEPTNFLDLESVLALERFLLNYQSAFLLISHDREFLRRVTESTLEIEAGEITKFPGHIDDYFEQKQQLQKILAAQINNINAKRKKIEEFVTRFGAKATKAKQAQSRLKALEKMEVIEQKPLPVRSRIEIPSPIPTGKEVLQIVSGCAGYGQNKILDNLNFRLERGAHLGVVGMNGAGKSTLLKTLAGKIPLISGEIKWGYQVNIGYFAQHVTEELRLDDRIIDCLENKAHASVSKQDILNIAGSLLFSGDDIYKRVRVLSGGEKSRVALGQILLQKCPVLLLDEPTNHLDFDTVEALTEALRNFEGTLVLISHDRGFVRRVASQILEVRLGRAEFYPGTYDEYVWSLEKGVMGERIISKSKRESFNSNSNTSNNSNLNSKDSGNQGGLPDSKPKRINSKEEIKALMAKNRELEKSIKSIESKIVEKSKGRDLLTESLLSTQGIKAEQIAKELADLSKELLNLEEKMLEVMEEQSQIELKLGEISKA